MPPQKFLPCKKLVLNSATSQALVQKPSQLSPHVRTQRIACCIIQPCISISKAFHSVTFPQGYPVCSRHLSFTSALLNNLKNASTFCHILIISLRDLSFPRKKQKQTNKNHHHSLLILGNRKTWIIFYEHCLQYFCRKLISHTEHASGLKRLFLRLPSPSGSSGDDHHLPQKRDIHCNCDFFWLVPSPEHYSKPLRSSPWQQCRREAQFSKQRRYVPTYGPNIFKA